MIRSVFFALALLVATPVLAGDPIWNFDGSDPEMNQAIETARETLPRFVARLQQVDPSQETMLLKVAMPYGDNGGFEHIWAVVSQQTSTGFIANLANHPVHISMQKGDLIKFGENQISDWSYWNAQNLMEGAYTIRVMLPRMDPDQAAELEAGLAPLPVK
jgi:uncharacterized protein YegJ (DUF2314 family)